MSFQPVQSKSSFGRSSGGFGAAAGMVDLAGAFQAQRRNAPKFDELYATGIANRANERSGIMEAKAAIIGQGMAADAAVELVDTIISKFFNISFKSFLVVEIFEFKLLKS